MIRFEEAKKFSFNFYLFGKSSLYAFLLPISATRSVLQMHTASKGNDKLVKGWEAGAPSTKICPPAEFSVKW
jgi:hypothetical protein